MEAYDSEDRTFNALIIPWGQASNDFRSIAFARDSVTFPDPLTRVKLHSDHDTTVRSLVGMLLSTESNDQGVSGTFQVASGPDGDRILSLIREGILDGVSVQVISSNPSENIQTTFDKATGVTTITGNVTALEVSLTSVPALSGARTFSVQIPENLINIPQSEENTSMADEIEGFTAEQAAVAFATALTPLVESVQDAVALARESASATVATTVPTPVATAVPRVPYGPGSEHSFVRDGITALDARKGVLTAARDTEALSRFEAFSGLMDEGALALSETPQGLAFTRVSNSLSFAAEKTTDHGALVPDEFRSSWYQEALLAPTPLLSLVSQGTIRNANSFTFPKFVGYSGLWAETAEGVNPTDGTVETDTQQVTAFEMSGQYSFSRRLADGSNPSIDRIALQAMADARTSFAQAKVLALLNSIAAADTGPGAVLAITGTDRELYDALSDELVDAAMRPGGFRFTGGAVTPAVLKVLRKLSDDAGRPLLPRGGGDLGGANTRAASVTLEDAVTLLGASSLTASGNNYLVTKGDLFLWTSPVTQFTFVEKNGPANITLAAHGYGATAALRTVGVTRFTYTAA